MTENPDLRSVRVEIEHDPGASADVPAAPALAIGSRLGIVTGIIGLGIAALLIASALRSDGIGTAVDDPEAPATSGGIAEGVTADVRDVDSALPRQPVPLFEPTLGAEGLRQIVRAPVGFLGLMSRDNLRGLPSIARSADGLDWVEVEVSLDDSISVFGTEVRRYEQLIRTDEGYALLMTSTGFGEGGTPSTSRIERLVSDDGGTWRSDGDFVPLESASSLVFVVSHSPDAFIALSTPEPRANQALRDLLHENVNEPDRLGEPCFADLITGERLRVSQCAEDGEVIIERGDTTNPDQFEILTACAAFLSQGSTETVPFVRVHRGGPATELPGTVSPLMNPTIAEDGSAVTIDFSGSRGRSTECETFGVEGPLPTAVVVWDVLEPTAPRRFTIPGDINPVDLLSIRAEATMRGRQLLLLVGASVMSIDVDTGEWSEILGLPVPPDDEASAQLSSDRSRIVYMDSSRVNVIRLGDGESAFFEAVGGGNRPGFPSIIYTDNQVAFARSGDSVFKIDLPEP